MRDAGVITVRRKASLASSIRKLDVLVDGKRIGNIANGSEQRFVVGTGWHRVQVKLLAGSQLLAFDLSPNQSVELECGVARQFWIRKFLLLILCFLIASFGKNIATSSMMLMLCALFSLLSFRMGATYYLKKVD